MPDHPSQSVRELQKTAKLLAARARWWRKLRRAFTEVDKIDKAIQRIGKKKAPAQEAGQ